MLLIVGIVINSGNCTVISGIVELSVVEGIPVFLLVCYYYRNWCIREELVH